MSVLGDERTAGRWWRTSARVAGESGDSELTALILGRHAVLALYGPGSDSEALARAAHALAVAGGRPCAGAVSAHSARAQACARMGRHGDALAAMDDRERVWERLPESVILAASSEWGQPESKVLHTRSWVLTKAGDTRAALAAQDAALAMYPPGGAGRMQVEMHRVETLIRAGDVDGGARHCVSVLTGLPGWRQDALVVSSARAAMGAVPASLSARRAVSEAREMLVLPAGQR